MKSRIIYTTSDGFDFDSQYEARKHECELTSHRWEYFNDNMGVLKEKTDSAKMRFCKYCNKQEILK